LRWDWNNDSIFDTDYLSDKEYVRRFSSPGWHYIIMEATDVDGSVDYHSDSILIYQGNGFVDSIIDPRDGQVYTTARINHQWVMTENLRYGQRIDTILYPQYDKIPEYYTYLNDPEHNDYGGLYTWDETMNYVIKENNQGICPPGWHVPSSEEWANVLKIFPSDFTDMMFYWGKGSPTGFNLEMYGFYYYTLPPDSLSSWYPRNTVAYWTSDHINHYLEDPDDFIYSLRFFGNNWQIRRHIYKFDDFRDKRHLYKFACYVRCFKDSDQ